MTCSAIRDSFSKQYRKTGVFVCPGKRASRMSKKNRQPRRPPAMTAGTAVFGFVIAATSI